MKTTRWKSTGIIAGIGLALSASGLALAETELTVENDGMSLTAGAFSSDNILSINLRVVGPDGFVFEERVKDSLAQWVPQGELADGLYSWEATAVTLEADAPVRQDVVSTAGRSVYDIQGNLTKIIVDESNSVDGFNSDELAVDVPAERLYSDRFKSVERQSGTFRVQDGWIIPTVESEEGVTNIGERGLFQSIAGALVDFVFPSAHADCPSPCDVDSVGDAEVHLNADSNANQGGPFDVELEVLGTSALFQIGQEGGTNEPFRLEFTAPEDSLRIRSNGNIGLGTGAPTEDLHISSTLPEIRLEDTNDAQSWFVKNSNSGQFEISETSGFGAFVIQPTARTGSLIIGDSNTFCDPCVGIGTSDPERNLHISTPSTPAIYMEDTSSNDTWQLLNLDGLFQINHSSSGGQPVIIEANSPDNALRIQANGDIGMGTDSPITPLHVRRSDGTAGVLVEETAAVAINLMLRMINNGNPGFQLENSASGALWQFRLGGSGGSEQFTVNKVGTGSPEASFLANGDLRIRGTLNEGSSRALKQDIKAIDPEDFLERVDKLQLTEWSYTRSPENRHFGPMSEDFYELFGLGGDPASISPRDLAGVALAASQAIMERNESLEQANQNLSERLKNLERAFLELQKTTM